MRAAVPDATDDEIETYAEQINGKWHPDNLARYIRSFPAFAVADAIAGMRRGSRPRPADTPVQDLCRCGQLHGGGEACPELAPPTPLQIAPELPPEPAESEGTPCAYSGCRIREEPVDPATRLHEACAVFAGIADGGRRSSPAEARAS